MTIRAEGKTSYPATVPAQLYGSFLRGGRRKVPKLDGLSSCRQPAPIRTENWRRNSGISEDVFGGRRRREIRDARNDSLHWGGSPTTCRSG